MQPRVRYGTLLKNPHFPLICFTSASLHTYFLYLKPRLFWQIKQFQNISLPPVRKGLKQTPCELVWIEVADYLLGPHQWPFCWTALNHLWCKKMTRCKPQRDQRSAKWVKTIHRNAVHKRLNGVQQQTFRVYLPQNILILLAGQMFQSYRPNKLSDLISYQSCPVPLPNKLSYSTNFLILSAKKSFTSSRHKKGTETFNQISEKKCLILSAEQTSHAISKTNIAIQWTKQTFRINGLNNLSIQFPIIFPTRL